MLAVKTWLVFVCLCAGLCSVTKVDHGRSGLIPGLGDVIMSPLGAGFVVRTLGAASFLCC